MSPLSSEDEKEEETAGGGAPPSDNEVGAYAATDEDIKDEPVRTDEDNTKENEEDNTKENDVNDDIVQEDKDIKDLTPPHTPTTPSQAKKKRPKPVDLTENLYDKIFFENQKQMLQLVVPHHEAQMMDRYVKA